MYSREFTDNNNKTWKRIDKRKARNLYNKGVTLVLCPDNLRPFGFYQPEAKIDLNYPNYGDFDKICNEFRFYNCVNCETGYNIAFYKEVE